MGRILIGLSFNHNCSFGHLSGTIKHHVTDLIEKFYTHIGMEILCQWSAHEYA